MNDVMIKVYEFVIPVLLLVCGFLLARLVKSFDRLEKNVQLIRIELAGNNTKCEFQHKAIDKTQKEHTEQIHELKQDSEKHEHDITVIKGELKLNYE